MTRWATKDVAEAAKSSPRLAESLIKAGLPSTAGVPSQPRHRTGEMNKTEAAYYEHLKARSDVVGIYFERMTLKLGDDCRYTPDFMVVRVDTVCVSHTYILRNVIEFHEVKGAYIREDARVKVRVAPTVFAATGWEFYLAQMTGPRTMPAFTVTKLGR